MDHHGQFEVTTLIGRRCWVTLAVPAEVAFQLLVGRHRDCTIEKLLVESQSVRNCWDPLGRLPRRVRQVWLVSSRRFAEWTATVSIGKGETIGVEAEAQKGLVWGLELGESVDDGSGCVALAHCRLPLQSAMRRA